MNQNINEIEINGVKYVPKTSGNGELSIPMSKDTVIVRSETAGVFCGQLSESNLTAGVVSLKNARRFWYWSGAASLSQLAVDGTNKPKECKFPTPVPSISITKVIEVIPCSEKAIETFNSVAIWKA